MSDQQDKWNKKYLAGSHSSSVATPLLVQQAKFLPEQGRALDVAGGAGRHAIWLAEQGLDVTLADFSPVALEIAQQRSDNADVSIRTVQRDIEAEGIPAGPWDVIVSCYFLWRPLYESYPQQLSKGGRLFVVQPTPGNQNSSVRFFWS